MEGSKDGPAISIVYVTVPDERVGDELASKLVGEKLAACVNIVPGITSIYSWEGKINKDKELMLIIKTRSSLVVQLTQFVKSNHPYETPEVIALPVTGGSEAYINWIVRGTAITAETV